MYPLSFKDSKNTGSGDINGIIQKIPYLKSLGVGIVWITPIYESPMDDNGYDISDYYKINPLFGTFEDFKCLLKELHNSGIKLIMDLVVNHTSDEHHWFQEAIKSKDNKYRDYYIFNKEIATDEQAFFSGSVWEYEKNTEEYYYHLFSKKQPDLNWNNKELRFEIYKMINFWLDLGIDGFRLDVIDFIGKDPLKKIRVSQKTHEYLEEMYKTCFESREKIMTVGEMTTADIESTKIYTNPKSKQLDMVFNFEIVSLTQASDPKDKWKSVEFDLIALKKCFEKWQVGLHNVGWNSLYWNNHDQPRVVSTIGSLKYHQESSKMLGGLLHGMQGTPYIYQGEEIGMTNIKLKQDEHKDIATINLIKQYLSLGYKYEDIEMAVDKFHRDNARSPMQWDDSLNAGFSETTPWIKVNPNYVDINVAKDLKNENGIIEWYKKLILLRKNEEVIIHGDFSLILENDPSIFGYSRKYKNEEIIVIANFFEKEINFNYDIKEYKTLLHNYETPVLNTLRPFEFMMLKKQKIS